MKSMMTIQEAASLWQITTTQVTRYCRQKRIPGAIKQGRIWMIPKDSVKPVDLRRASTGYDDKEMHLEGIFQSGNKVIKLSIIEILYFIYKDKDVAETFIKAYEEYPNE